MDIVWTEDPSLLERYLHDEAHLNVGSASRLYFPTSTEQVSAILSQAYTTDIPVTISGGGTGIASGRVPTEGWIIATEQVHINGPCESWTDVESGITYQIELRKVSDEEGLLRVPVGITLKSIQNLCKEKGWFYPPDPTERSSFIGGNFATNASGARSFKFGPTREWVEDATVVLPKGEILKLSRDDGTLGKKSFIPIRDYQVPVPSYTHPKTRKNVAGPVLKESSQPIDLFIGTDGIFGVVTEITLKLIRPPKYQISIFMYFASVEDCLSAVNHAASQRDMDHFPIPLSVEFMDDRAVRVLRDHTEIPEEAKCILMLEQDAEDERGLDDAIEHWVEVMERFGAIGSSVATTSSEIENHKQLRHKIPETVNAMARANGSPKLGTDYAAPSGMLREYFEYIICQAKEYETMVAQRSPLGDKFSYALWGHAGDCHLHLNFLPRDGDERRIAMQKMIEIMQHTVRIGGTIAAEHGLGKKKFGNKPALYYQIGHQGLEEIRKMKKVLDPKLLLNRGNLFSHNQDELIP